MWSSRMNSHYLPTMVIIVSICFYPKKTLFVFGGFFIKASIHSLQESVHWDTAMIHRSLNKIVVILQTSFSRIPSSMGIFRNQISDPLYSNFTKFVIYLSCVAARVHAPGPKPFTGFPFAKWHYNDVIMGAIASQITSLTSVYSIVYSEIKQNIKAPRHWPDRWIPRTNGQSRGLCFHLMTSSCKPANFCFVILINPEYQQCDRIYNTFIELPM